MHPLRTVRKRFAVPAGFKTSQNLARIFRFTGGIKMNDYLIVYETRSFKNDTIVRADNMKKAVDDFHRIWENDHVILNIIELK